MCKKLRCAPGPPLSTFVVAGKNYFGHDLAGGDNAYDASHAATKIRSAGIWFSGFNGTFNTNATGGGLANAPRVYLIPIGEDVMRSPTRNAVETRSWTVFDQAIPLPYNGGGADELLRFGLNGSGGTGIYVSTDGGANYSFLDCGWDKGTGDTLEYNVGWDASGNYTLAVNNLTEPMAASFTGTMTPGTVSMLGAAVFGASSNEGLAFDGYEVVPEPATALPVALLIALVVARRVWQTRPRWPRPRV